MNFKEQFAKKREGLDTISQLFSTITEKYKEKSPELHEKGQAVKAGLSGVMKEIHDIFEILSDLISSAKQTSASHKDVEKT